ncbi:MAG: DUF3788 domain-containing protein [Peptococcaceae bacterium]|nr:DUF3788 domain-containing protein [Peptococcaceae bacterium]
MAVSILVDKSVVPDSGMVAAVLADSYPLWDELVTHVNETYPNVTEEWKHYGKAFGWTFKLISKKRNLLFLVPLESCFRVRFVLGERAVACAETANLPKEIMEVIRAATPHVEGRSIDIDITLHEQLEVIKSLLKIKYEN